MLGKSDLKTFFFFPQTEELQVLETFFFSAKSQVLFVQVSFVYFHSVIKDSFLIFLILMNTNVKTV